MHIIPVINSFPLQEVLLLFAFTAVEIGALKG